MSRATKNKNGKVPKITEEEYAAYVSALKRVESIEPPRVDKSLIPPVKDVTEKTEG